MSGSRLADTRVHYRGGSAHHYLLSEPSLVGELDANPFTAIKKKVFNHQKQKNGVSIKSGEAPKMGPSLK